MRIHIYSKKADYLKVISLLCEDIHREIEVNIITECQLVNAMVSHSHDLFIIDDRLYDTLTDEVIGLLESSGIRLIVLLLDKLNVKKYLSFNVVDYFTSPLHWKAIDERLREEFRHDLTLEENLIHKADKLIIKTSSEINAVKYSDILFLEKDHKNTRIHTLDRIYECHDSLKELLIRLPEEFIRIHSAYVVNFDNAKAIKNVGNRTYHITFDDYEDCAVMSRHKSEEMLEHSVNHFRMSIIEEDKKG